MIATIAAYTVFVTFASYIILASIDHARQTRAGSWDSADKAVKRYS